jgi:two-component system sensor histidine kinase KdpD
VEIDDGLPLVRTDPALLERVVANLVENAVRFSPESTPVEVRAEVEPVGAGADVGAGAPRVILHVVDHGPGVRSEDRAALFAPFRQLGDRGTGPHVGLGLAIVRGFCDAVGADVHPSTTPGGGLTMTVTLPAVVG